MVPTLSKIAPNGQIWEFTGSRMDHSSPNYVARLFYFEKIKTNDKIVQKKTNMLIFLKTMFENIEKQPPLKLKSVLFYCFASNLLLLGHIIFFLNFFEVKKTRNVIWRLIVHTRARELPYLTIW